MKKTYFILSLIMIALAGCQRGQSEAMSDLGYYETDTCLDLNCQIVRYDTPNGNDLLLETPRHIIQIDAQPNVRYSYRVWAGEKTTSDDADLIVEDGNAMILVEE